jgi:hypothetical protein
MKPEIQKLRREYRQLQRQFSRLGWLSHGYVQDRGAGAGGPCYQWSRKESKKTVSVALSKEQYAAMKEASENWRKAQLILKRMEQISRWIIFHTLPDTKRRKALSQQVLGLN